jgi:AcrR family transcriptional regulator
VPSWQITTKSISKTKNPQKTKNVKNVFCFQFVPYICRSILAMHTSKKDQIVHKAMEIFLTYGIKSMTMDDIARQMHISKKTLYEHVKDKNDLVMQCVGHDCTQSVSEVDDIIAKNLNAIDENFEISACMVDTLKGIHPSIFYDLEKYHPDAFAQLNNLHHDEAARIMRQNMEKGVAEGLYRDDFDIEIITRLWVSRINAIFDPALFPMQQFSAAKVYEQMFTHHIRGIASKKGLKYLEQKMEKLSQQ